MRQSDTLCKQEMETSENIFNAEHMLDKRRSMLL